MVTRRSFLAATCGTVFSPSHVRAAALSPEPIVAKVDLGFLRGLARATVRSATIEKTRAAMGFDAVTPGGDYPSLWIRDFSMAAGSDLIPTKTVLAHLRQIAKSQTGVEPRTFHDGVMAPPWSVPDHITFDGGAVFFPGTYSAGPDQGGEPFGSAPPIDDQYEFVHLAALVSRRAGRSEFLHERIGGVTLYDRLVGALDAPRSDPASGLVITDSVRRAVGFGFCDTVCLTGSLAFPSLLRFRALTEMVDMAESVQRGADAVGFRQEREKVRSSLSGVLQEDSGWLRAATGIGRQPDVWATVYALHLGILSGASRDRARGAVFEAYQKGTVTFEGAVRHVPTDRDFSPTSAWEKTAGVPLDRYQNGAYWHTPSGWFASALSQTDKSAARRFVGEYMAHMRREDFRQGQGQGGPWECVHPQGRYRQNPVYMASVTLPYGVFLSL